MVNYLTIEGDISNIGLLADYYINMYGYHCVQCEDSIFVKGKSRSGDKMVKTIRKQDTWTQKMMKSMSNKNHD